MRNSLLSIGLCAVTGVFLGCGSSESSSPEAGAAGVSLSINNPESNGGSQAVAETQAEQKAVDQLIKNANVFAARGMGAQAIEALGQGIGMNPGNSTLYRMRAKIYGAAGEYASAMADYSAAVRLSPQNAEIYNVRGFFLMARGESKRAEADFSKAVELNPEFSEAWNNRGLIFLAANKINKAVADFSQAIKTKDDYVDAHNNLGFAYYKGKKYDQAVSSLNRALQINPDYVNAYNNRGLVHLQTKNTGEAVNDFTEAIKRNRFNVQYYVSRRAALTSMNQKVAAQADGERIQWLTGLSTMSTRVARERSNPTVYINRGRYFEQAGEQEAAIVDYSSALKLNPANTNALVLRAAALNVIGRYDQAIADCDSALKFLDTPTAHSVRGDAWMKKGDLDRAIADFKLAERFDTSVAQAYLLRANKLEKAGDKAAAEEDRRMAKSLDPNVSL